MAPPSYRLIATMTAIITMAVAVTVTASSSSISKTAPPLQPLLEVAADSNLEVMARGRAAHTHQLAAHSAVPMMVTRMVFKLSGAPMETRAVLQAATGVTVAAAVMMMEVVAVVVAAVTVARVAMAPAIMMTAATVAMRVTATTAMGVEVGVGVGGGGRWKAPPHRRGLQHKR